jgi:hypothetical protein
MDDETGIGVPPGSVGLGHRRHAAQPLDEREALIERDLNDVYLLMDHLSGRSDICISDLTLANPADPANPPLLIDEVCKIRWPLPEEQFAHAKQAAILFKARDKLNQIASPANGATIAYTILVLGGAASGLRGWLSTWLHFIRPPDTTRSRTDLARAAYPNLVHSAASFRSWITVLQFMLLGGLLVTSLLSWNVASGKLILQRIDQLDAQAVDIGRSLDAGEVAATTSAAVGDSDPNSTASVSLPAYERFCRHAAQANAAGSIAAGAAAGQSEIAIRREQICATARLVMHRRMLADRDLDEWVSYWGWLKHLAAYFHGVPADTYSDVQSVHPNQQPESARGASMEQWSADLMTVLGNFVLPMLYGFLGATTAVVLGIQNKLRESLLAPREKRMSQVQLVLGIIVGACIGLFMSPSSPDGGAAATAAGAGGAVTAGGSVALSASALSFLAGFGVESVFKMLQNMLQAMFGAQGSSTPSATQRPPAG